MILSTTNITCSLEYGTTLDVSIIDFDLGENSYSQDMQGP